MYLWLKAFHIIFMVCWFAGIFYLPRLFVYHAMSNNPDTIAQLRVMERKLYYFVTPFAILTVVLGLWMVWLNWQYLMSAIWFHIKFTLVLALIGYHIACGYYLKRLAQDGELPSHRFFRVFNELPVLILFAVIILVVVRPI